MAVKQNGDSSAAQAPSRQECRDSSSEAFEAELLTRLVALNHARAAEEKRGHIRWLRPDYQNPDKTSDRPPLQGDLDGTEIPKAAKPGKEQTRVWPQTLTGRVSAVKQLLPATGADAEALSASFGKKTPKRTAEIAEILAMLRSLGGV